MIKRRHACLNLLVFPATMQGANCATDVIRGLRYFNNTAEKHRVDLVVIARGGGSAEDLNGFNDEALARAIAASDLPVVSAVGHETDFTIADFVADLRAPTPSAAAEMITAAQHRVEERVDALSARLLRAVRYQGMQARQRYLRVSADSAFARMRDSINRRHQRVDGLRFRLEALAQAAPHRRAQQIRDLTERLQRQDVQRRVLLLQSLHTRLDERLQRTGTAMLQRPQQRLERSVHRLHALSPKAILQRGYALVYRDDGTLLRDASDAPAGTVLRAQLASGEVRATVTEPSHPTTAGNKPA